MTPGTQIAGRFEIERRVGAGGMAAIYRALDRETGEPVAIKVVLRHEEDSVDEAIRFDREARSLAELRHPAVVRYVAHGTTETGEPYLAMEWLEGEDLSARLAREGLTFAESLALTARVADALALVHARGLVHRDIKPANLFLVGGRVDDVKLIDFGVARRDSASVSLTKTGMMIGTPGYMAPEQARGHSKVGPRADVFSLGCVLFRCLTGRAPFEGEHLWAVLAKVLLEHTPRASDLRPEVPPALDALLLRMLSKDPGARPATAAVVLTELAALGPLREVGDNAEGVPSCWTRSGLTAGEQRVTAMLLVNGGGRRSPSHDERDAATVIAAAPPAEPQGLADDAVDAIVVEHGGHPDRLVDGTRIVTFVGAAVATDLAARAARCALALRAGLPGATIVLAMVRSELSLGLPVGDAIDRAARMLAWRMHSPAVAARASRGTVAAQEVAQEAAHPPAPLLPITIDDLSAGLLDARFDVRAVEIGFELHGARGAGTGARTLLGRPTVHVGREWELSSLDRLIEESIDEPIARAVLVTGAAGMGKSRLLHEFMTGARGRTPALEVWLGRGDSLRAGSALGLLGEALRGACGIQEGEPLDVRRAKVRERVARHVAAGDRGRVAEFLGELVGSPFPDESSAQLRAARQDAVLMSEQLRCAWEDLLDAETAAHPVLLVLDDLHWGDLPTVRFVDSALRSLARRPWLVIAPARPEVHALFPKLWSERNAQEIRLAPLSRRASERLVRQVLADTVSVETAARIAAQADGNAFYLEELIRAVAEGRGEGDAAAARLPETVLAMVQARLGGLEPDARRVLRAASLFGDVFWTDGLAELLGTDAATVNPWLDDLLARELIVRRHESRFAGEPELSFRHGLLREGAYGMLTERDRELGHQLAGAWLERHGEGDPMLLAQHFERGRDTTRAVVEYLRAAEQALRGDDQEAAITRAERGISCGASGVELGRLRLIEAEGHFWRGEHELAAERGTEAAGLLPVGSAEWFHALTHIAQAASPLGNTAQIQFVTETAHATAPLPGAEGAQIICVCTCATQLTFNGGYAGATTLVDWISGITRDLPELEAPVVAAIEFTRGCRAVVERDLSAGLTGFGAALAAFEAAGDRRNACRLLNDMGAICLQLGDFEQALGMLRAAEATALKSGLLSTLAVVYLNLGRALTPLGQLEEARRLERKALQAFLKQQDTRFISATWTYLAHISLAAGDFAAAEGEALNAVENLPTHLPLRIIGLGALARALLGMSRVDEALTAAAESFELLASLGSIEEGEAMIRLAYAETLRAAGREAEFVEQIVDARARVLARAELIRDPVKRERFLAAVPENARTLALAAGVEAAAV